MLRSKKISKVETVQSAANDVVHTARSFIVYHFLSMRAKLLYELTHSVVVVVYHVIIVASGNKI
mgnify:CR=1 FL=1